MVLFIGAESGSVLAFVEVKILSDLVFVDHLSWEFCIVPTKSFLDLDPVIMTGMFKIYLP